MVEGVQDINDPQLHRRKQQLVNISRSAMAASINSQDDGRPPSYLPIPDMLAGWPWQRRINPLAEEVSAESSAWLRSFSPFTAKSQHAFDKFDLGLLTSLMFPDASRGALLLRLSVRPLPLS